MEVTLKQELQEIFDLIKRLDIRGLVLSPTRNSKLQFLRAVLVGGLAFLADAAVLWLVEAVWLHYLTAAVFGFIVGVAVNYVLSKLLVFKSNKISMSRAAGVAIYVFISAVGLGLTELFMIFFTETVGLYFMLSKVISAFLVFIWNYYGRRLIIYREKKQ
jgi:putative flippase GtrA